MNKLFTLALTAAFLTGAPSVVAEHHKSHKMNMTAPMTGATQGAEIVIRSPWARASVGRNGAAYFTLVNSGESDIKLVGVSAGVAKRVELHTHKMEGDIMRMRPLEHIIVPAGTTVTLKPGGHHVMLMGLTQKLKEGDSFPLTMFFENAGRRHVSVKIGKIGAAGPMDGMKQMDGNGHHRMKH